MFTRESLAAAFRSTADDFDAVAKNLQTVENTSPEQARLNEAEFRGGWQAYRGVHSGLIQVPLIAMEVAKADCLADSLPLSESDSLELTQLFYDTMCWLYWLDEGRFPYFSQLGARHSAASNDESEALSVELKRTETREQADGCRMLADITLDIDGQYHSIYGPEGETVDDCREKLIDHCEKFIDQARDFGFAGVACEGITKEFYALRCGFDGWRLSDSLEATFGVFLQQAKLDTMPDVEVCQQLLEGIRSLRFSEEIDGTKTAVGGLDGIEPQHPRPKDAAVAQPRLKSLHKKCLTALRALRAKSPKTRKTAEEVAVKVDQHYVKENIKGAMADLSRWGYIDSLTNRPPKGMPGGSFITQAGLKRLKAEVENE